MLRPGCGWVLLLSNVKHSLLKNCSRKVTFIFILVLQSLAVLHHGEGSSSLMLQLYETLQCQCVQVVFCLICGSSLFVTFSELHVPLLAVQNTDELLDVKLQAQYIFLQLNCCCCVSQQQLTSLLSQKCLIFCQNLSVFSLLLPIKSRSDTHIYQVQPFHIFSLFLSFH